MKPNYETIYLVPTDYDGGQLTYSWCDCPAPGEGMDPADAIKYVRADLVPASNEVLANSIAELTRKNSELMAQVDKLRKAAYAAKMFISNGVELGFIRMPDADIPDPAHNTLPMIYTALNATPAQCLAEVKAQAVEQVLNHFSNKFRINEKLTVQGICWMLDEHLKQLRQQAKVG